MKLHSGWELEIRLQSPIRAYKTFKGSHYKGMGIIEALREVVENWFPDLKYRRERRDKQRYIEQRKDYYKKLGFKSVAFKSFFDDAHGEVVWNAEQLKERERQGEVMMTHEEAKSYANKKNKELREETRKKTRESMRKDLQKIIKRAHQEEGEFKLV